MRILFLVLASLLLAGCSTNVRDCDPTTGDVSIVTKFNCNYSGTWDKRIEQKQQTLQHEQVLNKEFKAVYDAIELEKNQTHATVASKRKNQQALERSLNNLVQQLKTKTANQADAQKQLASLEKSLQAAANQPSKSEMQKQMELETLRNQVSELENSLALQ